MWNCFIVLTHTAISCGLTSRKLVSGTEKPFIPYPLFGIELHCARFYSQETSLGLNCSQIHELLKSFSSLLTVPWSPCLLPVGAKGCLLLKKQTTLGVSSRLLWCFCLPGSVCALTSLFILGGFLAFRVGGHSIAGLCPWPKVKVKNEGEGDLEAQRK